MTAIITHLLTYGIPSFHTELIIATRAMASNSKQELRFMDTELCTSCLVLAASCCRSWKAPMSYEVIGWTSPEWSLKP